MQPIADYDLRPLNTFGIGCIARYYVAVTTHAELLHALQFGTAHHLPVRVLGGGSNVLFTTNFLDALVIHIQIQGIDITRQTAQTVHLTVGAGLRWHSFVLHCLENNWGGVENLALIYGTVGAAPMQNIGAYGCEIKDVCTAVTGYDLRTQTTRTLSATDCAFGYRSSIFKTELKDNFIITQVHFALQKPPHSLQTNYAGVAQQLPPNPSIQQVAQAIIHLRQTKLPNPEVVGNAGSFFKNPVVTNEKFSQIKSVFLDIVGYKTDDHHTKLSAAWLIEQCAYKGRRTGDAGTYTQHSLVLVNYGRAQGSDILQFATEIQQAVLEKFGVGIVPEVNIW